MSKTEWFGRIMAAVLVFVGVLSRNLELVTLGVLVYIASLLEEIKSQKAVI